MSLMPTPKALDGVKGNLKTSQERIAAGFYVDLPNVAVDLAQSLLPTPNTMEHLPARTGEARERQLHRGGTGSRRNSSGNLREDILEVDINWGKFEPAIRRWEEVMGRPAPAPTLPDGKDGAHRLSPWLTEWMMGLPEGWICDPAIGLSRNDQLKAAGNGVCPQQAELALEMLGIRELLGLPEQSNNPVGGGKMTMLPTPTVSDTFTDNLASTQQKEGSMHSVTLPQAVRMVQEPAKIKG